MQPLRSVGRSNFDKGRHNLTTLIKKSTYINESCYVYMYIYVCVYIYVYIGGIFMLAHCWFIIFLLYNELQFK